MTLSLRVTHTHTRMQYTQNVHVVANRQIEICHYVASIYLPFALIFVRRRYVNFSKNKAYFFSSITEKERKKEGKEM